MISEEDATIVRRKNMERITVDIGDASVTEDDYIADLREQMGVLQNEQDKYSTEAAAAPRESEN